MRTIRTIGTSLVAQVVKSLSTVLETQVRSLGLEDLLEKGMATHSSILAPSPQKGAQRRTMGVFREYFWCAWHYDMTWYVSLFVITATQKRKCFRGLPRWHSGEESACQYRRHRRCSFKSLGPEDPLEKEIATYFSILAWNIPWTVEPGGCLFEIGKRHHLQKDATDAWTHGWESRAQPGFKDPLTSS